MNTQSTLQNGFVRAAVFAAGIFYALSGVGLFFAPRWFYDNVGTYPPFNRHYTGDVGSFLLPLGIALLIAARNPVQHRLLIGFAVAGSLLHAVNHLYDDLAAQLTTAQVIASVSPLFVFAAVLALAYVALRPDRAV